MEGKKITPQELKNAWAKDVDELAEQVAAAINAAQPGNIINESEEPVRDASAEFRRQCYQKAVDLLQDKHLQEDFSPSEDPPRSEVEE